jgi:hypothetical protein
MHHRLEQARGQDMSWRGWCLEHGQVAPRRCRRAPATDYQLWIEALYCSVPCLLLNDYTLNNTLNQGRRRFLWCRYLVGLRPREMQSGSPPPSLPPRSTFRVLSK